MKNLKIYFTSDLHGYIYPTNYIDRDDKPMGLLNIINSFKKDGNTLIIDGGDTIQGSPFTYYLSSYDFDVHPMATIMNHGKYDYITLGNHDFNYGLNYLGKYLNNLKAKCLCANVLDETNTLPIMPYDIKTLENGLKVGLLGITTDFINRWERPENIQGIKVSDTFNATKKYFSEIKSKCDILVGIYHGGFEYDLENHKQLSFSSENIAYKLCNEFDFDIMLTGHQHTSISGHFLHNTFIAQTPNNGKTYLELKLSIDEDGHKNISSQLVPVALNPDAAMYDKFISLEHKIQKWLDTAVGFLDNPLYPDSYLDMALNGSLLANFINQIQLEESNADISCTSFANTVKGFNKNVTVRDIMSTYMYPNTLVVLEVNRKYLKLALEKCASYFDTSESDIKISDDFLKPKLAHYNYDYFTNLHYTFDLSKPIGHRVTSIIFNGKELDDTTNLTLVMNNYRATGAGGYEFYEDCKVVREILVEMPEVIINYFKNNSEVTVDHSKYLTTIGYNIK